MRILRNLFCLIVLLSSCDGNFQLIIPRVTYDSPFPKSNRDLTTILGDSLIVKSGADTLALLISSSDDYNIITEGRTQDTLFNGTVSMYRGLYYFSQQINDTSFIIYAVKLSGNLIYGLNTAWEQTMLVDKAIESGQFNGIVRHHSKERIHLHPDKGVLKKLYAAILDSIRPDTIIALDEPIPVLDNTVQAFAEIDQEDFEFFSRVYPNPTADFINVEQQQKIKIAYQLTDFNGRTVLHGQIEDIKNRIDLSRQEAGIYYFSLIGAKDNHRETVKIVISK